MAAKNVADALNNLSLSEEGGVSYLDKLPDELLLKIMAKVSSYNAFDLIKLGCACRRMRHLSCHPSLWTDIEFRWGFTNWLQLEKVVAPRLHAGTRRIDLGERDLYPVRKGGSKKVSLI